MSKYKNLTNYNKIIFNLVSNNQTVLDVGCGYGVLGKRLIDQKKAKVFGIDSDNESVLFCKNIQHFTDCKVADLNNILEIHTITYSNKFDYIIFADILEHLIHPNYLLVHLSKFLKQDGKIIISVPNIAFVLYRVKLLFGIFKYEKYGVMDETHCRFFTKTNYLQILPFLQTNRNKIYGYSDVSKVFFPLKYLAKIFSGLFALQLVIISEK